MSRDRDGFLSRWSRLKQEAAAAAPQPPAPAPAAPAPDAAPPELPPIDSLTADSDFSAFLHPRVEEGLKRQAMRKLFSDPHFNSMDGLDVYIDDYTIPDPLPEGMLENLTQYRTMMGKTEEAAPEAGEERAGAPGTLPEPDEPAALAEDDGTAVTDPAAGTVPVVAGTEKAAELPASPGGRTEAPSRPRGTGPEVP